MVFTILSSLFSSFSIFIYRFFLKLPLFLFHFVIKSSTISYVKSYPMEDSSASYIRMVHHLIEECILFNMSKEECMEALSKHANIKPVITSTVWKELEKENKEFFEAYSKNIDERASQHHHQMETRQKIKKMLSDSWKIQNQRQQQQD